MLEALGANPVGMPVPQLPQALSNKVVDGATIPFEVALPLKVHELVRYHTEFDDGTRLGTSVFLFAMNRDAYEGLPNDLKAVIDANSGAALAEEMGRVWMEVEEPGIEAARTAGNEIILLDEDEKERFEDAVQPAIERWLAEVDGAGIDGPALLEAARAAVQAHGSH